MKKTTLILLLLWLPALSMAQEKVTFTVPSSTKDIPSVLLVNSEEGDTLAPFQIDNSAAGKTIQIPEKGFYFIYLKGKKGAKYAFLEDGVKVQLSPDSLFTSEVLNSATHNSIENFHKKYTNDLRQKLVAIYQANEKYPDKKDSLMVLSEQYQDEYNQQAIEYVRSEPTHLGTLSLLKWLGGKIEYSVLKELYDLFPKELQQHSLGQKIYENDLYGPQLGTIAPAFTASLIDSTTFTFTPESNEVLLIDFWGSWCGPCIAAIPKLKELHEQYKNVPQFKLLSVAYEYPNEPKHLNMIKRLGMEWTHAIEYMQKEGMIETSLIKKFNIVAFPTIILIDKKGKIVYRTPGYTTLTGLKEKLKEVTGY